ncbi:MAG: molybdopterin molybdotransferase MoeA [Clostridia bacterium]|nr:molybdopterin molybdotransferase MoeA [Clostridia bacterium]
MLKVVSTEKALEIIREIFSHLKTQTETVALGESLGRTLSEDILSEENIPAFNRSTVDGFAVRAKDTYGSSESVSAQLDIIGEILMGEKADTDIGEGECIRISTGGMLPENADSVVMVEHTDCTFPPVCLILKAVSPFENVTKKGDDTKEGDIVFRKGEVISSREVGVLASLGKSSVPVSSKPRVGIISTGDEIVSIEGDVPFGKIRDINTHILSALISELGCISTEYGIIRDSYDHIYNAVKKAVSENDIVLISGGSSAGARDMTAEIISTLGELYIHGIAMKPGKPTILGNIDGKAVFGLPGHPAAAYFVTLRLVKPLIDSMLNRENESNTVSGKLTQNISSNHGREELLCVKITPNGVLPVFGKSGIISLLSGSDGYIIIDRNCEGLKQGDEVQVILWN